MIIWRNLYSFLLKSKKPNLEEVKQSKMFSGRDCSKTAAHAVTQSQPHMVIGSSRTGN
jgi:hypothetical protein